MGAITVAPLDASTIDGAARVIAREHAAALEHLPLLPTAYGDERRCREALTAIAGDGSLAVAAGRADTCVGVLCARVKDNWALLPLETFAIDPDEPDPTAVLVAMYARAGSPPARPGRGEPPGEARRHPLGRGGVRESRVRAQRRVRRPTGPADDAVR